MTASNHPTKVRVLMGQFVQERKVGEAFTNQDVVNYVYSRYRMGNITSRIVSRWCGYNGMTKLGNCLWCRPEGWVARERYR